ncbi:MAG: tRNA pseudouridine synthase C [Candidatus Erwinia impunctatus]|nr:tRNA pseudouridine synthase C [Culicoides impunctatus]
MLDILYQDDDLIAVNKPAGWLVHRSWLDRHETRFIMQTLRDQIGQHVFTVHRLDRPTSGVLLLGLSSDVARALAEQFEQHRIKKTYHALVRGWLEGEGTLDYPLREEQDKIADKYSQEKPFKSAITRWRALEHIALPVPVSKYPTSRFSLVELIPETGRKHQLRRHMAHLRHPIIGDSAHGDLKQNRSAAIHFGMNRLMLHASQLTLDHPVTGQKVCLSAPLDPCWEEVMTCFNWQQHSIGCHQLPVFSDTCPEV